MYEILQRRDVTIILEVKRSTLKKVIVCLSNRKKLRCIISSGFLVCLAVWVYEEQYRHIIHIQSLHWMMKNIIYCNVSEKPELFGNTKIANVFIIQCKLGLLENIKIPNVFLSSSASSGFLETFR